MDAQNISHNDERSITVSSTLTVNVGQSSVFSPQCTARYTSAHSSNYSCISLTAPCTARYDPEVVCHGTRTAAS